MRSWHPYRARKGLLFARSGQLMQFVVSTTAASRRLNQKENSYFSSSWLAIRLWCGARAMSRAGTLHLSIRGWRTVNGKAIFLPEASLPAHRRGVRKLICLNQPN
jgi:hypothetical protein